MTGRLRLVRNRVRFRAMDIHIQDEALFVVPASGALWSYDFGNQR